MNRLAVAAGMILFGLAAAGALVHRVARAPEPPPAAAADSSVVLDVDAFMRAPEAHPGPVRVRGVVSTIQSGTGLLTLIDRSEWEACGVVTCATLSLPVQWSGAMPEVKAGVEVLGRVETRQGKLVLVAERLEPLPEAPPGGADR